MVQVTATLVETTAPRPVQVAVTDAPDGPFTLVGVAADGSTWPVPGGVGVLVGGSVTLVDNRAPLNTAIRYRVTCADGSQAVSDQFQPGAVVRRNLVPVPLLSLGYPASPWAIGTGFTAAAVSDGWQIDVASTASALAAFMYLGTQAIAATAGEVWSTSVRVRVPADAPAPVSVVAGMYWYGTAPSGANGPVATIQPGQTADVPANGLVAPAGTTAARITLRVGAATPAGTRFVVLDNPLQERAPAVGEPFSGDTAPSASGIPAWEGARNASASVMREAVPVMVEYPSHVIQSLDGETVVDITSWRDNGMPAAQVVRSVAFDVPGRRRPPRRHAPTGDGGGTLEIRTTRAGSAALRDLVGQTVVVRTDGTVRDWPPVEMIAIDSAPSVLWGAADRAAPHGMSEHRVWTLGYTLADDPEPGTAIALWGWDDFDAYWAGRTWTEFDAFFAGQDWTFFDQMAWE